MSLPSPELTPDTYVQVGCFSRADSPALFGALALMDGRVELVVIEDDANPLLERHAELHADRIISLTANFPANLANTPIAKAAREMFDEASRQGLIDDELKNLRTLMTTPEMGIFAVAGAEVDVAEFLRVHAAQPYFCLSSGRNASL